MRDRYIILGRVRRPDNTWPTYSAARARRIGSLPRVFLEAMDALEVAAGENRPFFLVADCFDLHEPWDPPQEYVSLTTKATRVRSPWTTTTAQMIT